MNNLNDILLYVMDPKNKVEITKRYSDYYFSINNFYFEISAYGDVSIYKLKWPHFLNKYKKVGSFPADREVRARLETEYKRRKDIETLMEQEIKEKEKILEERNLLNKLNKELMI